MTSRALEGQGLCGDHGVGSSQCHPCSGQHHSWLCSCTPAPKEKDVGDFFFLEIGVIAELGSVFVLLKIRSGVLSGCIVD